MSASVASKNLYELLGNDPPEDEQPSKVPREVTKSTNTSRKRDEKVVPAAAAADFAPRGNGRGGRGRYSGNDAAFRDRDAGRVNNRTKTVDSEGAPRGSGRGRGGRSGGGDGGGSSGGRREYDRHSGTGKEENEKQAGHGWGANKAESEWKDELAGAELAQKDADAVDPNATTEGAEGDAAAVAAEEEDKTKTYDEYLAELTARQANLGPPSDVRRPNEGTREDKKWANAKALDKAGEQGEYFAGESKDKTRNRERKTKTFVEIEPRFVEPRENRRGGSDRGGRGGRGSDRGRGGRGDRGSAPRVDRAERGGSNRGRGTSNPNVNINDSSSFPALGA